MPTYEVTGTGRDSGRKRHRVYKALDEAHARAQAEADETIVASVTQLPPEPPTERQLAYAKDHGISVPAEASQEEVSDLIDAGLHRDKPAAPRFQAIAKRYGVVFTQYTGKKALFDRVFARLCKPGLEEDMTAWFVFRVYRELVGGKPDASIKGPDEPVIRDIAKQLAQDQSVVKSIRRYQGRELVWFGEWTSPDRELHSGGSNNTISYKRAASLLREKMGAEVRPARGAPPGTDAERSRPTARSVQKKGCLSLLLIVAVILLLALGIGIWIEKTEAGSRAPTTAVPPSAPSHGGAIP